MAASSPKAQTPRPEAISKPPSGHGPRAASSVSHHRGRHAAVGARYCGRVVDRARALPIEQAQGAQIASSEIEMKIGKKMACGERSWALGQGPHQNIENSRQNREMHVPISRWARAAI